MATVAAGRAGARSAGVCIAWRKHLTVTTDDLVTHSHRVVTVTLTTRATGYLTVASVYLPQGEVLRDETEAAETLHATLRPLTAQAARALIAGDFNQHPDVVQAWLTHHEYPFTVICQRDPTFVSSTGRSNIDFFIASTDVAALLRTPTIDKLSGLAGHRPVTTGWTAQDLHRQVTVWKRTPRPSVKPVYGPLAEQATANADDPDHLEWARRLYPCDGQSVGG